MKKIIVLLFFLAINLPAQTSIFTKTDLEINNTLFSGDWEKSDSLIEIQYKGEQNSLKYGFMKAYNSFYTRYLGNNRTYTRDETITSMELSPINDRGLEMSAILTSVFDPTLSLVKETRLPLTSTAVTLAPWLTNHSVKVPPPHPASRTFLLRIFGIREIVAGRS